MHRNKSNNSPFTRDINVGLIILPNSWLRSISVTVIILQIINTLQTKLIIARFGIASVNNKNFITRSYYRQSKHQGPIRQLDFLPMKQMFWHLAPRDQVTRAWFCYKYNTYKVEANAIIVLAARSTNK
jgi:hypothetical protein